MREGIGSRLAAGAGAPQKRYISLGPGWCGQEGDQASGGGGIKRDCTPHSTAQAPAFDPINGFTLYSPAALRATGRAEQSGDTCQP